VFSKYKRVLLTTAGLVFLVIGICALASRYVPITQHLVVLIAAISPYLIVCGPASMTFLLLAKRPALVVVAAGLTVAMLAVQLPLFVSASTNSTPSKGIRVISANLRYGRADPDYLVRSAEAQADVLAFQELTPQEVERLSAAGLDKTFPYRWLDARRGATGVGLWSRWPLEETTRVGGYAMALVTARIRMPGISIDPTVMVVHIPGPLPQPIDGWGRDLANLPSTLRQVAGQSGGGCMMVAGDFNSTTDMHPFRALLRDGYRDAAEQSGAGIQPTFPADSWMPPLIAIDHVITRGCTATSLETLKIPGSDHRGLVVSVAVPR
jgi:endonuclease/exonuclease/phosphatase (EEP) superfamily protein YafD